METIVMESRNRQIVGLDFQHGSVQMKNSLAVDTEATW